MSRARLLLVPLCLVLTSLSLPGVPTTHRDRQVTEVVATREAPSGPSREDRARYQAALREWYLGTMRTAQQATTTTVPVHRHPVPRVRPSAKPEATYRAAAVVATPAGLGPCGGDLPPCPTKQRESHGDYRIWNRGCYAPIGWSGAHSPCGGSTASGGWQITRGTWNGFCWDGKCYLNAADAPPEAQDEKARQLWAHGCGAGHWGLSPRAYGC